MRRHISSDNIASSSCLGTTSAQPCHAYQEETMEESIYASKNNQKHCCKQSNEYSRQDACNISNLHKKENFDTCSCLHSHHHCPYPSVSGFAGSLNNDYATSGCDHHRYIHPASDMNSCMNSIPVILCRPEQIYGNKFEENLGLQHSSMYAVPIIPQTRCACLSQSNHGTENEGNRAYDLYDKVTKNLLLTQSLITDIIISSFNFIQFVIR